MAFFQKDSPFVVVPAGLESVQRVWLDAVRGSCQIASAAYNRLFAAVQEWTINDSGERSNDIDQGIADAWTFIDAANRLQILLNGFSKYFPVKKRKVEPGEISPYEQFKRARKVYDAEFRGVRDLRNAVQHLNERLKKLAADNQSVWGNLSWAAMTTETPPKIHWLSAIPGPLFNGARTPPIDLHRPLTEVIGHIRLAAFGVDVDLTKIHAAMEEPIRILERLFAPQFKDQPSLGAGAVIRIVTERVAAVPPASPGIEAKSSDLPDLPLNPVSEP
jgi:hypothetical protein